MINIGTMFTCTTAVFVCLVCILFQHAEVCVVWYHNHKKVLTIYPLKYATIGFLSSSFMFSLFVKEIVSSIFKEVSSSSEKK